MRNLLPAALAAFVMSASLTPLFSQTAEALTADQWRADLAELEAAIEEEHFQPYASISRGQLDQAFAELEAKIPALSDRAVILEMAKIVALLEDGHTRLAIPRRYPELALAAELGHSGAEPAADEALAFSALPVAFSLFEDGLFITGAHPDYRHLIGRRVEGIGAMDLSGAVAAVTPYTFRENEMRARLMAPDRLALPDLLAHAGIVENAAAVPLVVEGNGGEVVLPPLEGALSGWISFAPEPLPLWLSERGNAWHQLVADGKAMYVRLDEFEEFPDPPLSDFIAKTVAAARAAGAEKFILDLRHNHGGAGAWTASVLTALAQSEYNRYGRLFVLIGRETYSASQLLVNQLEQFTYAMFAGEKGGSAPSHFGDPVKVRLTNSGLTVRISKLYWHSWTAGEFRDATNPHIAAPMTGEAFFAAHDPALEAVLEYTPPETLGERIAEQFRAGNVQNGVILFQRYLTDGTIADHSHELPSLLAAGHGLLDAGLTRPGHFMFLLAYEYLPTTADSAAGFGRSVELMGEAETAAELYREALALDPGNGTAKAGLARLGGE